MTVEKCRCHGGFGVSCGRLWALRERRGRDSNPRYGCPYAAFRVRCIQPLCHLSIQLKSIRNGKSAKSRASGVNVASYYAYAQQFRRRLIAPRQVASSRCAIRRAKIGHIEPTGFRRSIPPRTAGISPVHRRGEPASGGSTPPATAPAPGSVEKYK